MTQQKQRPQQPLPRKFLRFLGLFWLGAVALVFLGNSMAPHLGRCTDVFLQYVWHWDWHTLTLEGKQPFFDLFTPESTIKSYYSALYRSDATHMEQLTQGAFREQMRQRFQIVDKTSEPQPGTYRSYIALHMQTGEGAEVHEKFHLFWQQGLRFRLRKAATAWQIVAVDILD